MGLTVAINEKRRVNRIAADRLAEPSPGQAKSLFGLQRELANFFTRHHVFSSWVKVLTGRARHARQATIPQGDGNGNARAWNARERLPRERRALGIQLWGRGLVPRPRLPGQDGRRLFEAGAGAYDAADAQGLRMTSDLVGENLGIAQDAVQPRHHPRHLTRHVVEVLVEARIGQEALQRAVVA